MQISVAKVIKGLINLVYAVNLITIKASRAGEVSKIRGAILPLPGVRFAAPRGEAPGWERPLCPLGVAGGL